MMMTWAKILVVLVSGVAGSAAGNLAMAAEPDRPTVEQAQKALEADLEVLHQKGEPVRPQEMVAPSVQDAENAVLDLRAAVKSIYESKALAAFNDIDIKGEVATPLSGEQADVIRALVKENAPALTLIKSAMAKGKVDWQINYTTPMFKTLLPGLSGQRMLANVLLRPAALLAHEDGDDITALQHVRELLFVARASGDEPFLVSHLVEIGIDALAFDVCRQISPTLQLVKEPAMREQLRRTIAELLDETDFCAHMRYAMQCERLAEVDPALALVSGKMTVEELVALGGSGQKENFKRLGLKPADAMSIALTDARIMLGEMTRMVDVGSAADLPTALAKMKPWPPAERMEPKKHFYMAMLLPSLQKSFETHYIALAQRRLAATALAIRWYAMDHDGQLPKALKDLVPAYLPTMPTDPMTVGDPLIYSPEHEVVYSVGIDGHDDGGDAGDGKSRGRDIVIPLR